MSNEVETPPTGTIDITDLVEKLKKTWIKWAVGLVVKTAQAYVPFLAWPVVSQIFEFIVSQIVTIISNAAEMQGFFINTAIRKASQAKDFVDAVDAREALPPTATNEEYENAEAKQMLTFRNLVMVTN